MERWIAQWEAVKAAIVPAGAAERSLVHVHLGMLLYLVAILCARRGFRAIGPVLLVSAAVTANEAVDLARVWPAVPAWLWRDSAQDVLHSAVWPWLIWMVATARGADGQPGSTASGGDSAGSGEAPGPEATGR